MDTGMATEARRDFENLIAAARGTVATLSNQLDALSRAPGAHSGANGHDLARRLLWQRRVRGEFFSAELLGEPAWDLLLCLYCARRESRTFTSSTACAYTAVAPTTALRWLRKLEDEGLVRRFPALSDKRVTCVDITDEAFGHMSALLTRIRELG